MKEDELRQRVIEAARAAAAERGWPFIEPVEAHLAAVAPDRVWSLRTNALSLGRNARFRIRESDLAVLEAAYLPR